MATGLDKGSVGLWIGSGDSGAKKIAGPCTVNMIRVVGGAAITLVKFYDGVGAGDAIDNKLMHVGGAGIGLADAQYFNPPITFLNGIYAVQTTGGAGVFVEVSETNP